MVAVPTKGGRLFETIKKRGKSHLCIELVRSLEYARPDHKGAPTAERQEASSRRHGGCLAIVAGENREFSMGQKIVPATARDTLLSGLREKSEDWGGVALNHQ